MNITNDDFCRACYGKRGHYETQPAYAYGQEMQQWCPCWLCQGTGKQTVLINPARSGSAQINGE